MPDVNYFEDTSFLRDIKRCYVIKQMQSKAIKKVTFEYDSITNMIFMDIIQDNDVHMQHEYKIKKRERNILNKKRQHSPETYKSNKRLEMEDNNEDVIQDDIKSKDFIQHDQFESNKRMNQNDTVPEVIQDGNDLIQHNYDILYTPVEAIQDNKNNSDKIPHREPLNYINDEYCQDVHVVILHVIM